MTVTLNVMVPRKFREEYKKACKTLGIKMRVPVITAMGEVIKAAGSGKQRKDGC